MPELTKIRVREAKPRDRGLFKKLWKSYLEEERETGGIMLPTEANIETSAVMFDNYVDGTYEGVVLFVADKAVLMYGDPGMVFETTLGKVAWGWGIYVHPDFREKGIAKELTKAAVDKLISLGFNRLYGEIRPDKEASTKALESVAPVKVISNLCIAELNGEG